MENNMIDLLKKFANNTISIRNDFSQMWRACADFGVLSAMIPKSVGGLADNESDILQNAYLFGKLFEDNGFLFAINNSMIVSSFVLPRFANQQIIEELYPKLNDGSSIASFAITEPSSGSDVYNMKTNIRVEGSNLVLNGSKTYISNSTIANYFVVIAVNEHHNFTAVIVSKNDTGVSIGNEIKKMGLNKCPFGEIYFNNCIIPQNRVIGKYDMGKFISDMTLDWERCLNFASNLGIMERIMNIVIEYVNHREQFGESIGNYQLVSSKIAQMKINVEIGKLLLNNICDLRKAGKITYLESSIFKYFIGENYVKSCLDALQILGAYGYSKESGIEREVRDSLAAKIYSGTSELQLDIIARLIGVKK